LLLSRLGAGIARDWLTKQLWSVEPITPADVKKAKEIIQNYTDKEFSYTDATSFAVMERLVLPAAFAFDVHFKQYGLKLLA
jgi:predicted nucleic acid-binding protein